MMKYEEFEALVQEQLGYYLPEGAAFEVMQVPKNNGVQNGVRCWNASSNVSPIIYLESYYREYVEGAPIAKVFEELGNACREYMIEERVDTQRVKDYDWVKDKVYAILVNGEKNAEYLKGKPYTPVEDLAVVYRILIADHEEGRANVDITDRLMAHYGIDKETLHQTAMENTRRLFPAKIENLNHMLREMSAMLGVEETTPAWEEETMSAEEDADMEYSIDPLGMHVLTNTRRMYGAVCILYPDILERIREQMDGDFYLLPSSIHEMLIVSKSNGVTYQELERMVHEVNATELEPEDILSEHVYSLAEDGRLYRCDLEEQRLKEKREKEIRETEKTRPATPKQSEPAGPKL